MTMHTLGILATVTVEDSAERDQGVIAAATAAALSSHVADFKAAIAAAIAADPDIQLVEWNIARIGMPSEAGDAP